MRFVDNKTLKTEVRAVFSTYLAGSISRIRIGRVPPEFEEEWFTAAVLFDAKNDVYIVFATGIQQLNW